MQLNPKRHDALFKWLIAAFTEEFFAHYFSDVKIGKYRFIDKEFLSKYEALKESLEGDLFLLMEIEINGQLQEVAIQIEHQSKKIELGERLFEYLCYIWLLKKQPVWSIVIYTDDVIWRKPVQSRYCYGFSTMRPQQFFEFDVIKINAETSYELMRKHSILCRLLALKANDKNCHHEQLLRAIGEAVTLFKAQLNHDQLLLINQWVNFYTKVPPHTLQQIKQEFNMEPIETTISEHIFNQGVKQGIEQGIERGVMQGKVETLMQQIATLTALHQKGVLSTSQLKDCLMPVEEQLKKLQH